MIETPRYSSLSKGSSLVFLVWLAVAGLAFHGLTHGFFGRRIGVDYDYFFPWLLSGYYWFLHNGLAIPWFTPALCAGIPHFANPQSMFYALPQVLTFFANPLIAVQITVWVFGFIGFAGMWLLATLYTRSPAVCAFAALAFALNDMNLWRMYVGHLSFHAFMLLPLVCYLLLKPEPAMKRWLDALLAGGLLAYFVHSGASVLVVPVGACMVLVLLALGKGRDPWLRLLVALAFGSLLSLVKLVAVYYFMAQFPRSLYPLPGTGSVLASLELTLRALVWPPGQHEINRLVTHHAFLIEPVELNYAIGLSTLLVIVACGIDLLWRGRRPTPNWRWVPIGLLLCLPVALDVHSPLWDHFLKSLPYFANVSSLFRWNLIYLVPAILLAVRLLELTPDADRTVAPIAALAVVPAALSYAPDYQQLYDPAPIVTAWQKASTTRQVPPVRELKESLVDGERASTVGADDVLVHGASQIVCNEPLFGYRLENFRFDQVFRGPVFGVRAGGYNFYRPECFLFPHQNQCTRGDRFGVDQATRLLRLTDYDSMAFRMPAIQRASIWISYVSFILLLGIGIARFLIFVLEIQSRMRLGQSERGVESAE